LYNDPCFSNTDTLTPSETGIPTDEEKEVRVLLDTVGVETAFLFGSIEHSNIPFFIIDQQDLSAALSAAQNALTTGSTTEISIPVPNASNTVISAGVYSRLYKADYHVPETLIRFFGPMDDMLGCPYVMDTIDNDYLATHRDTLPLSEDDLEKLLWEYECIAKENLPDNQLVSVIPTVISTAYQLIFPSPLPLGYFYHSRLQGLPWFRTFDIHYQHLVNSFPRL
jgi:hypothetical protein